MNRKDCYITIQENGWTNEIRVKYGKNFTNCTTEQLKNFIEGKKGKFKNVNVPNNVLNICTKKSSFDKLVDVLIQKHILLPSEVSFILK